MDKDEIKARGQRIIDWISSHPMISRKALCDAVGYSVQDLFKVFQGKRTLPEKYFDGFEKELARYGYIPE